MINNEAVQNADLSPYAKQPTFYIGSVRSYGTSYAECYIDGLLNEYVDCVKPSTLSLTSGRRVVIMEIGGTYLVLARIT